MTRGEKINKLARAIKELRGSYHPQMKKWLRPPNPARAYGVMLWAKRLGLNLRDTAQKVESFKSITEFNEWIRTI